MNTALVRVAAVVCGFCVAMAGVSPARAQDRAAEARARFERAIAAFDANELERAERLFRESIALRRSGSALFNLATLLERQSQAVEALRLYEEVAQMTDVPPEVVAHSRERMADLAPRLAAMAERDDSGPDLLGPGVLFGIGGAGLVAALATGIAVAVLHADLQTDCAGGCRPEDLSRAETGRALSVATDVLWIVGGATATAGLVWLVVAVTETGADADAIACGVHGCGARW